MEIKTNKEEGYVRIGTTFYKVLNQPRADGTTKQKLAKWDLRTLKLDHTIGYIHNIPKYEGFCLVPAHVDYQRSVNGFYNRYEPTTHTPAEGNWSNIRRLVEHTFGAQHEEGSQYELGLDYLQLLYLRPTQKLPILLLVSAERNTGKTTFLNFLKEMFQDNVTFNSNEDFRSQFNSDWATKLLIVVDEALLNRVEDSEHLKNLSTTQTYKMEAKGKDREEVPFYGKFVLCSNNEHNPVFIDDKETRYWVRKVDRLDHDDVHFVSKLREEIPAFLHFLTTRQLTTEAKSRMWFSPEDIHTDALTKIVDASRFPLEYVVGELLLSMLDFATTNKVEFTYGDIQKSLSNKGMHIEMHDLKKMFTLRWNLEKQTNSFPYISRVWNVGGTPRFFEEETKGRYFTITRDQLSFLGTTE